MGELDPGRHGGAQPRPAAAPRLAVDGGDGHGELGPGGLGELDLGTDMGELNPGGLGELAFGGGDGVGRGRVALVVRTQRWALCGDVEGPSEDTYLGSASAPTQNGSWVCLLRWSVFCLPKTLCTTHFWVWLTLCVCCWRQPLPERDKLRGSMPGIFPKRQAPESAADDAVRLTGVRT